ncbi:hypothetical protein C4F40_03235 [Sphingobacterium sp. Ka21]|uniref:Uncharacterized protein n=1 Tax=Sphingobacterium pedocola TaxID=2082722 RepID=A0ABR9T375_9SPHI|nr:hypothetical protein [Sphingobacterium pedocola]
MESSRIIERLDPDYFKLSDSEHPGEFWLRDGILVQIVSRKITPEMPGSDPEILYYTSTPQVIQQPGNKVDDSRKRDYYSEYKIVDGSSTFLQYYRSTSNRTRFVLHDKQKRYQIIGHIRCKPEDLTKANHFAKTLLESIIIK